jgi:hypothetical protein
MAHPVPLELARLSPCPLTVSPEEVPRVVQKRFDYTRLQRIKHYQNVYIIIILRVLCFIRRRRVHYISGPAMKHYYLLYIL